MGVYLGYIETQMNLMAMDFVVVSVEAPGFLCSTLTLVGRELRKKKNGVRRTRDQKVKVL